jgi:DNA invertase Pin-like site-specific DNA recombinase
VYVDHASGTATARPQLNALLRNARPGDTIVVWRLDRLGRNMKHLLELVGELEDRGIGLRSLNEQIDTTSANGRLMLHMFSALAEFEGGLLVERTQAGLQAARSKGRIGGRPKALTAQAGVLARDMHGSGNTVTEIAESLRVSRATIYRQIAKG